MRNFSGDIFRCGADGADRGDRLPAPARQRHQRFLGRRRSDRGLRLSPRQAPPGVRMGMVAADQSVIARHISNAFKEKEVTEESNMQILHNTQYKFRPTKIYNLDVIISVGYTRNVRQKKSLSGRWQGYARAMDGTRTNNPHLLRIALLRLDVTQSLSDTFQFFKNVAMKVFFHFIE